MSLLQTKYGEIHKREILLFIKTLAYILCTYFDKSAIFFFYLSGMQIYKGYTLCKCTRLS